MNREIKFRAWDKIRKQMYLPESLLNNPLETGYIDDSGCPKYCGDELMQYTGLKDRLEKEIYEGDIIAVKCECGYEAKLSVEWGHNGYRLNQIYSHNFSNGEIELRWVERMEVIGNIYENPEILKR